MDMKINKVTEPKYSSDQLKEFEEKYGFSSEYFYFHYKQDENIIDDDYEAAKWAFEHEVNQKSKKPSEYEMNDEEDDLYSRSSFFLFRTWLYGC